MAPSTGKVATPIEALIGRHVVRDRLPGPLGDLQRAAASVCGSRKANSSPP